MRLYSSDQFVLPLPEGHRFPASKYTLLRQRVEASGLWKEDQLIIPQAASAEQLALVHDQEYIRKVFEGQLSEKEIRRIGFPWSPQLVERSRRSVGGTIAACRAALRDRVAADLAGGTHHAYADHGEGYCVFNDVAVAARAMQTESLAQRVVILDCDVHQGNGTAAIFSEDPSVYTFSIHSAKNYPFHKEASDLDIALPDGTTDGDYLEALRWGAWQSIVLSQAELAIYLAGADPLADDRLGRLALTKDGLRQRDRLVFELCKQARLPVAITMSGGYGKVIENTVDAQFQTLLLAQEILGNLPLLG